MSDYKNDIDSKIEGIKNSCIPKVEKVEIKNEINITNLVSDKIDSVKFDLIMCHNFLKGLNLGLGDDSLKKELKTFEQSLKELTSIGVLLKQDGRK